ncbi:hypothetical protein ACN47E_009513 [Coniothyrium glycines]
MRFFAAAAALVAVAAAQYSADETCSAVVTVTVTETLKHTPSAPAGTGPAPTGPAPYPTTASIHPSVPVGTGRPVETPLASTVGTIAPPAGTGTGASSAPYPEFTGAASGLKVGGALAGVGAVAALFL